MQRTSINGSRGSTGQHKTGWGSSARLCSLRWLLFNRIRPPSDRLRGGRKDEG